MQSRTYFLTSVLFSLPLGLAIAIIPPPHNPAGVFDDEILVPRGNTLDYDLPLTDLNERPQCDGRLFGRNLRVASCDMLTDFFEPLSGNPIMEFDQTGHRPNLDRLPLRWLSSDGLCALDIAHRNDVTQAKIRRSQVVEAANAILDVCVKGAPSTRNAGGAVARVGENKDLVVIIRNYRPRVSCTAPAGQSLQMYQGECRKVISTISVSDQITVFGNRQPLQGPQVSLPHYFTAAQTDCMGLLTAPTDTRFVARPYDIWAAASAIDNLCVRNGKSGAAKIVEDSQGSLLLALTRVPWRITGSNSTSDILGNSSSLVGLGAGGVSRAVA